MAYGNAIDFESLAIDFLTSPEGIQCFVPDTPKAEFCKYLYELVLGQLPDEAGLDFWVTQLESDSLTMVKMLIDFANSQENVSNTDLFVGTVLGGDGMPGTVPPGPIPPGPSPIAPVVPGPGPARAPVLPLRGPGLPIPSSTRGFVFP